MKTLKDLERFEDLKHQNHFIVSSAVLKQEAIKWIKDEDKLSPSAKAGFIEFFNINEEEKKIEFNEDYIIKIPKLNIEIEKEIHHKGKSYNDLVKEFGKEFIEKHLPTYAELQFLRNSNKYRKLLNLDDTWEFVKQEDKISKKDGFATRFGANSNRAYLDCYGYPDYGYPSLGVRFVKRKGVK